MAWVKGAVSGQANSRCSMCGGLVSAAKIFRRYIQASPKQCQNFGRSIQLNDGNFIPTFGLGLYKVSSGRETIFAVKTAVEQGYKLIDTATYYKNEKDVGAALKDTDSSRSSIYIVTKVWDDMHGYNNALTSLKESLKNLDMEYIDLVLIHSPCGGKVVETWKALEDAKSSGLVKSIGVSNFGIHHIRNLSEQARHLPVVNQIEVHPLLQEKEVVEFCHANKIAVMAYSPLAKGKIIKHPAIIDIALKYSRTSAQILIRWSLQRGLICIPKSVHADRISENIKVFDFELDSEDMAKLYSLEEDFRTGTAKIKSEWKST